MTIDAGFPFRNLGFTVPPALQAATDATMNRLGGPSACDERVYHGSFDLELNGNDLSGSLLASALISFTRNDASFTPADLQFWQFLHDTTFTISDPDESLEGFLLDHPTRDPFTGGLCPGDTVQEPLNNLLIYNGAVVPNGQTVP